MLDLIMDSIKTNVYPELTLHTMYKLKIDLKVSIRLRE